MTWRHVRLSFLPPNPVDRHNFEFKFFGGKPMKPAAPFVQQPFLSMAEALREFDHVNQNSDSGSVLRFYLYISVFIYIFYLKACHGLPIESDANYDISLIYALCIPVPP